MAHLRQSVVVRRPLEVEGICLPGRPRERSAVELGRRDDAADVRATGAGGQHSAAAETLPRAPARFCPRGHRLRAVHQVRYEGDVRPDPLFRDANPRTRPGRYQGDLCRGRPAEWVPQDRRAPGRVAGQSTTARRPTLAQAQAVPRRGADRSPEGLARLPLDPASYLACSSSGRSARRMQNSLPSGSASTTRRSADPGRCRRGWRRG